MSLPESARVIDMDGPGGAQVLKVASRPVPHPGAGEVLIKVAAAGVNGPDIVQRQGNYKPTPGASDIIGLEIAGEVVATGPGASRYRIGDKVCALVSGGGYAEYCPADEGACLPIPEGLDAVQAAALPETFFTVWQNVFTGARLKAGETFLVHGGSSGIGTAAIQLAKAFGATVYATAGSPEKCAVCETLGAKRAINYREEDFVGALKQETGGKGIDVILDIVGGDYVGRNIQLAAEEGRIWQIAFQKGSNVTADLRRVMLKRLTYSGSTLRIRTKEVKARIAADLEKNVWPLLVQGQIKPVIDSTFPLEQAAQAHTHMESSAHIGKIILTL